ncbi:hypothetical protein HDA32_001691 [Spinactinospora alkalitolerans]|uniref:DUF742 domain-containing protein n=1 Tax=Spinactinospora alkalitolerans TaxID=687207 RepID=A0A852TSH5_9ACTN|nr:DUF742 domain-containing protein [Spinactinospora alkalitolerans]NYE46571.1 hypothetical protein [Spinactinospora alkalitolerans]
MSSRTGCGDPGRLVRPFAVAGATADAKALDLVSIVVATRTPTERDGLTPERETILRLCGRPRSIAELSGYLELPLSAVKLLVADMIADAALRTSESPDPCPGESAAILQAVLDGLRAL